MSALLIALAPFITSGIVGFVKNLPPFASLGASRTPAVRLLAAGVSVVYILAGLWVTGAYDPNSLSAAIQLFDFSLLSWLGSLGIFHAFFQNPAIAAALGGNGTTAASPRVIVTAAKPGDSR